MDEPSNLKRKLADAATDRKGGVVRKGGVDHYQPGERMVKVVDGVEYAFRWCPAGSFTMGCPRREWEAAGISWPDYGETPHQVTLTQGFWMLETPVTQEMWQSVMGECVSKKVELNSFSYSLKGEGPNYPMYFVNWYDCGMFCRKLSRKIGRKVSLPTEAQWEYACRAGTTTPFSFGSALNGDKANCSGYQPYGTSEMGPNDGKMRPVRSYDPNAWGLYDMHGCVWEWCQDYWADYPDGDAVDPLGPESARERVLRGGSWYSIAGKCRSACRYGQAAEDRDNEIGLRVVCSAEEIASLTSTEDETEDAATAYARQVEQARQAQKETAPDGETRMVKTLNGVEYVFRWCPPGSFLMGSPEGEEGRRDDETPHRVTLSEGFWMLETPVTQEMWRSLMNDEPRFYYDGEPSYHQGENLPVERVDRYDCVRFCHKLADKIGLEFSLPTEAQWEYACRAGSTTPFSFGWKLNGDQANCDGTAPCGTSAEGVWLKETTPVRRYAPNAWGLYDMHGNVAEWCRDWYGDYPSGEVTDPTGPKKGRDYVIRGGSWNSGAMDCRSAARDGYSSECWSRNQKSNVIGFRVLYSFGERRVREAQRIEQAVQLQKDTAPDGETRLVRTADDIEYAFRWCPPGSFLMGSPEGEECRTPSETQHQVTLTRGFWMLETPVTQAMWQSVMGESVQDKAQQAVNNKREHYLVEYMGSEGPGYPMYCVNWYDGLRFCCRLSKQIGLKLSLPTEAQWEYACRAGSTTPFVFGREFNSCRASCMITYEWGPRTVVKHCAPNAWGLYDMLGNVQEWCRDWYGDYPSGEVTDPTGPAEGTSRVLRGGRWDHEIKDCRAASRHACYAGFRLRYIGFRVVVDE